MIKAEEELFNSKNNVSSWEIPIQIPLLIKNFPPTIPFIRNDWFETGGSQKPHIYTPFQSQISSSTEASTN